MKPGRPFVFVRLAEKYQVDSADIRPAITALHRDLEANPELLEVIIIWLSVQNQNTRRPRPPLNFIEEIRKLHSAITAR